jgi:hypothetical protein
MNIDTFEIAKNNSVEYPESRPKALAAAIPVRLYLL